MLRLRRILARLRNLFRNHRAEQELAREVQAHLVLLADDFERRGMPPEDGAGEAACDQLNKASSHDWASSHIGVGSK